MNLSKYSFGIGDRFARQAKAQLKALQLAEAEGIAISPVWNKSYREHMTIGSESTTTRLAADAAVRALGWTKPYFLDADHINSTNVEFFLDTCDFYTIDVADYIGEECAGSDIDNFCHKHKNLTGELVLPLLGTKVHIDEDTLRAVAAKYLHAAQEAGKIYRLIRRKKGDDVVIEVSMDETDDPQSPLELYLILAALADEGIPVQTVAPKFTGRFNKGVDYIGDLSQFRTEFEQDVAVLQLAIAEFGLPTDLKLSVHSGSDKFSIYPIINETISKFDTGLHLKTAGTTWLEELIGLAEVGGDGLEIAKEIYGESLGRYDELCGPYATVIDIDKGKLPTIEEVKSWDGETYAASLRHNQLEPRYNLHFRQLLHVGYKVAAELGLRYTDALEKHQIIIGKNVTENIFERHIRPLFV